MTNQTFTKPTRENKGKRVAYINARVMDPASGLDVQGGLLTEGDTIADFGEGLFKDGAPEGAEVIDCGGKLLTPGLIDNQVHFREPGLEYKETIETGSKSAAAGGVTTVACMPNTKPVIDDITVLNFIHQRAKERGYCNVRAYGCISKGMKGEQITEMGLMVDEGAVGFTDDGLPAMNAHLMRLALEYSRELNVPIAQHAEDLNLSNGGCMNEGEVAAKLGLPGIPNASEAVIVARDIELAELTGGYYHVLHVSTAEAVELIRRGKERGLNITAEAAPHHFTLTDEAVIEYRALAKMNPPLRADKDRAAIIEGLKDGTIDMIATDHAPHEPDSKTVPVDDAAFGIVGLETMLPVSLELVHNGHMKLIDVIGAMTYKPADLLRSKAGRLLKGAPADLTLIDLDDAWEISPEEFHSLSKNTPYIGYKVKGRAVRTVVGGETVYIYG